MRGFKARGARGKGMVLGDGRPMRMRAWSTTSFLELTPRTEKRYAGVGGPLRTVSNLLSDLVVDGGADHLFRGGGASFLSPVGGAVGGGSEPVGHQLLFELP